MDLSNLNYIFVPVIFVKFDFIGHALEDSEGEGQVRLFLSWE